MLEQTAEVINTVSNGVWVQAVEPSGCGTCGGQGCSSRRIAELFQRKPRNFLVDCDLPLAPGDRVVIGIAHGSVLKSAMRAYGLPLGLMLAGALLAQAIQPGDGAALAGMLIGGAVGWLLARGGRTARPVVLRREDGISFQVMKGQS
ncbi:SoxR reducing system RseC family protein [Thiobacillus sp.]|uniref:SoxR reducing system RseC family protein n=1 Tax=Thiobacillus sp. TaxID=924 RepID=UPI001826301B|nr:SoxR reducing system RseC family protein [Thiobacillus sp.]MBC2730698.1 Fis family transcriptional regulator [Thiobacillus sp.]MBC2739435.1 SoxR reducing system RseC family protein [Thiobacillus sp.]MBC2760284.1 SoxR reducing system RseC family protein [Thiobacillus sp.]